ncbi:MAG: hypothetical protein OXE17_13510 [Chloroflexi bacterium]|nr:hypothetical protein [Chloroflexota bacterium]
MSPRFKHFFIRNPGFTVGLTALLLTVASACGTSVPTQSPPAFSSSPTPVQQDLPTATPRAELVPLINEPTTAAPNLEATVQAMVSATVEAMQQPGPTPRSTPAPNASANLTTEAAGSPPQDTQTGSDGPGVSIITQPGSAVGEATDGSEAVLTSDQTTPTGVGEAPENARSPEPSVEPAPRPEPLLPTVAPTPAATVTPSPAATPTEQPRGSSRNNPVPLGQKGIVQDHQTHWEVSVVDITPDAWDIIREENSFNKPPGEGKQFYLLRLRVKNVGEQRGFFVDYVKTTGRAVGWVYTTSGDSCGVFPGSNSREVFPEGEFELNVCWHIATADLSTLVMFWDEWPTPKPVWFDLR